MPPYLPLRGWAWLKNFRLWNRHGAPGGEPGRVWLGSTMAGRETDIRQLQADQLWVLLVGRSGTTSERSSAFPRPIQW